MSGDAATWVGSIGTRFVGLVAGIIAWRQYSQSRFKPDVRGYRDGAGRIVVRITNKGAGTGSVEDIDLLPKRDAGPRQPVIPYHWEVGGQPAASPGSSPFPLAGLNTVQVVLLPVTPGDITAETRVRVRYGNGTSSDLEPLNTVTGRMYGSTSVATGGPPSEQ